MAKRRNTKQIEAKRKKLKQDQDALLSTGLYNNKDIDAIDSHLSEEDDESTSRNIDSDNEEQDYELRPRQVKHEKKMVEGLPIKTSDGRIERVVREVKEEEEEEQQQPEEDDDAEKEQSHEEPKAEEEDEDAHLSPQERLTKIKEEVASLASKLIEDPEENISCLTRLRKMSESANVVTSQLAITALIPVFKSLAPGYKIRPLTDAEKRERVSKEVSRLRAFEQLLCYNYKSYVDHLSKLAKISHSNSINNKKIQPHQVKLGQLAAKAACELCMSSLRHFNNRTELFNIVARRLNKKPADPIDFDVFTRCIRVLETLLVEDEQHGDITHEVVRLLSKSIKDKKFRVDESVINIFLSLSLLHDYDPNDNKDDEQKKPKLKKKDRVHISKKERKARKERKEIEEEMRKAEQAVTVEERQRYQAQVLKMVLTLYLEILKAGSHTVNNSAGTSGGKNDATLLMAAVLEGLSRFGQMANFDLLGDFLEVLREIMADILEEHSLANSSIFNEEADNKNDDDDAEEEDDYGGMYTGQQLRTVLLCIATSFALVLNHSSTGKIPISIDLTRFVNSLYVILADLALDTDLELSHKSLRLADPLSTAIVKPSVNVSTKAELLLRCLDCVFFKSRNGTLPRASAFTKRLYLSILHTPEKTSLATLKFVGKLMSRYGEGFKGLWNTEERISGEGSYMLGIERANLEVELERCNSGAATLWENVLLDKHYSPMVKDGSRSLMKNSKLEK